jgi:hypothetical protein
MIIQAKVKSVRTWMLCRHLKVQSFAASAGWFYILKGAMHSTEPG